MHTVALSISTSYGDGARGNATGNAHADTGELTGSPTNHDGLPLVLRAKQNVQIACRWLVNDAVQEWLYITSEASLGFRRIPYICVRSLIMCSLVL